MQARNLIIVVAVAAGLGFLFSSVSTYDFTQHLDRQIHGVHCSFIPGLGQADITGTSGCQVAMMSPFSSMFRSTVWGGLPVALPGMGVFAFLLFFALDLLLTGRASHKQLTGLLTLAAGIPVLASVVMGIISLAELGTFCKLCVGIYVSSFVACGAAAMAWKGTRSRNRFADLATDEDDEAVAGHGDGAAEGPSEIGDGGPEAQTAGSFEDGGGDDVADEDPSPPPQPIVPPAHVAALVAAGVLFAAVPSLAYVATAPDHSSYVIGCGTLDRPADVYDVMVPMGPQMGRAEAIEILDPLCPACAAFEERLAGTGLGSELSRRALLFPLEDSCNWMVDTAVHPGACTVSEAVLCAGDNADEVLQWAFQNSDAIREASATDPRAAKTMVLEAFGSLRSCVGSPAVKARLNKSLRWAVRNRLQILTPQLYIDGVRLCDEDVDLGLEFALTRMLEMKAAGTLPKVEPKPEPKRITTAPEPDLEAPPLEGASEDEMGSDDDAGEPSSDDGGDEVDVEGDGEAADDTGDLGDTDDADDMGADAPAIPEPEEEAP